MKMGFLFSGIFWGVVVILIGVTIIINVTFHIRIPIFPILIGLFFVWLGLTIMFGSHARRGREGSVIFEDRRMQDAKPSEKHDVIFGSATIDLSRVQPGDSVFRTEVNTVFGSTTVRISPDVPIRIVASSAFGSIQLPDGSSVTFGDRSYRSDSLDESKGYLYIKANVVFGSLEFTR